MKDSDREFARLWLQRTALSDMRRSRLVALLDRHDREFNMRRAQRAHPPGSLPNLEIRNQPEHD